MKRILYVGLGGTGVDIITSTKCLFMKTYTDVNGKHIVPPTIQFLGIDTDAGVVIQKEKTFINENGNLQKVTIDAGEFIQMTPKNANEIYNNKANADHFTWFPEGNASALKNLKGNGAGQRRSSGRISFVLNYSTIADNVEQRLNRVCNADALSDELFEVMGSNVEIHIAFSIAGGTGCGTFLDMAYLLRRKAPGCKIVGYMILPNVYTSQLVADKNATAFAEPNAYGAIKDLDFLMGVYKNVGTLDYIKSGNYPIDERPFDRCYVIDNKNANNDTYNNIIYLSEMISIAMFSAAGVFSNAGASTLDNMDVLVGDGVFDYGDKKSWATALGSSVIMVDSHRLAELYAMRLSKCLIGKVVGQSISNPNVDVWLDNVAQIREDGGDDHNQMIDAILNPETDLKQDLKISNNEKDIKNCVDRYISEKQSEAYGKAENNKKEKIATVCDALNKYIHDTLRGENGINEALNILSALNDKIGIYMNELRDEKENIWNVAKDNKAIERDIAIDKFNSMGFLERLSSAKDQKSRIRNIAHENQKAIFEYQRREIALSAFSTLLKYISDMRSDVKRLESQFQLVASKIQNLDNDGVTEASKNNAKFRIDLTENIAKNGFTFVAGDQDVNEFIKHLIGEGSLLDLKNKKADDLLNEILDYSRAKEGYKKYQASNIVDILKNMPEKEMDAKMNLAFQRASVLFTVDTSDGIPMKDPIRSLYIGMPHLDEEMSKRFEKCYRNLGKDPQVVYLDRNDTIMIFASNGVYPAFAIGNIDRYENAYNNAQEDDGKDGICHFDMNIYAKMKAARYQFLPKTQGKQTNKDIRILWVLGLVIGKETDTRLIILDENGQYSFKDPVNGERLNNRMVKAGEDRVEAYQKFADAYSDKFAEPYKEAIDKFWANLSESEAKAFKEKIQRNYLNEYSLSKVLGDDLNKPVNKNLKADLEAEFDILESL